MKQREQLHSAVRALLDRDDWVGKRNTGNARAWRLDLDAGPPALRFEIELDCEPAACASYTIDRLLQTHGAWNANFVSGACEQEAEHVRLYHLTYRGQWPVSPRDFVYRAWLGHGEQGAMSELSTSVEDPRFPPVEGVVRGQLLLSWREVVALGPDRCLFRSMARSDIRGRVPGWVVTPGVISNVFAELGHIRTGLRSDASSSHD